MYASNCFKLLEFLNVCRQQLDKRKSMSLVSISVNFLPQKQSAPSSFSLDVYYLPATASRFICYVPMLGSPRGFGKWLRRIWWIKVLVGCNCLVSPLFRVAFAFAHRSSMPWPNEVCNKIRMTGLSPSTWKHAAVNICGLIWEFPLLTELHKHFWEGRYFNSFKSMYECVY